MKSGAHSMRLSGSIVRAGLVAPAALLFAVMLMWPLFNILLRSLNLKGRASIADGIYWGHYVALAQDTLLRQVVLHSLMLAVVATAVTALLAFPTAYIISRLAPRDKHLQEKLRHFPHLVELKKEQLKLKRAIREAARKT